MTDIDINKILPSIILHEFPKIYELDKANLTCPKCRSFSNIYDLKSLFSLAYCEGSQPPEVECRNILGQKHSHQIICAGVNEEHFHTICQICGYSFLLSKPE